MSGPPTKKRRGEGNRKITREELKGIVSNAIQINHPTASLALLYIIDEYDFHLESLQEIILEKGLDASFSDVKYNRIAPFVGLDPLEFLQDIETFELHRSRIPTVLLRSIIEDMDIMLKQYGPVFVHETEEATSRLLSPIFHRLIAEFGSAFRNIPESILGGRVTTKGRTEYYLRAFGSVSVLVIGFEKVGNERECLNAIAQVIAECNACDWKNSIAGLAVPVFGILWDGTFFQFFKFVGAQKIPHSFLRGAFAGDPPRFQRGLMLPDPTTDGTTLPFIQVVRLISETVFDLLLCAHLWSIEAFRDRSVNRGSVAGKRKQGSGKWDNAVNSAQQALIHFRHADEKRQKMDKDGANQALSAAQAFLTRSIEEVPTTTRTIIPFITDWDDNDIELA
ncbi:uncharacterized protein EI90DRAFT_3033376 [Cantharellus anzutake]|uniref:uncharacterized protein n=1 Tax=Cantharellus anzutake TaxID=1750568 RepID=UPI00190713BD|nr:uncharacterized protein EI90DRAFT_3033376 [Cantharellus anzutake]KAF8341291.1 hypothetical protein EI90DRAFT_3033376 [Cantharellus anzutake]